MANASGSPGVAKAIARYSPVSVSDEVAAFARTVVAAAGPKSVARAKALLFAAGRLGTFATSVGLELDPPVVLHPSLIERFIIVRTEEMSLTMRRTLRSNLRALARDAGVNMAPAPVSLPTTRPGEFTVRAGGGGQSRPDARAETDAGGADEEGRPSADPEASWGHRRGDGPGQRHELFYGLYLGLGTMVREERGPAVPELVRRALLTSCHVDPVPAFVPVLEIMVEGGVPLGDVLSDSGYSHRIPEHWALRPLLPLHPWRPLRPGALGPPGERRGGRGP